LTKRQNARLIKLKGERTKLMQAYYANAVPLDLLTGEQTRINRDIQEAESVVAKSSTKFEELSEVFEQVLWLLRNCYDAYQQAPDRVRRMMNQALFAQVYVDQEQYTGKAKTRAVTLAEPFGSLMALTNRPKQPLEKLPLAKSKTRPGGPVLYNQSLFVAGGSEHNTMVVFCLAVQNFSTARNIQKLYQTIHKLKDQANVEPTQERVTHASRLSPARRALSIDALAADYKSGWSLRQLAEKNGIHRETVTLQLRKVGVVIREPGSNVRVRINPL
jgi:hypothetical protein